MVAKVIDMGTDEYTKRVLMLLPDVKDAVTAYPVIEEWRVTPGGFKMMCRVPYTARFQRVPGVPNGDYVHWVEYAPATIINPGPVVQRERLFDVVLKRHDFSGGLAYWVAIGIRNIVDEDAVRDGWGKPSGHPPTAIECVVFWMTDR